MTDKSNYDIATEMANIAFRKYADARDNLVERKEYLEAKEVMNKKHQVYHDAKRELVEYKEMEDTAYLAELEFRKLFDSMERPDPDYDPKTRIPYGELT